MKGIRFVIVASLLAISSCAYAQFTNASSVSSKSSAGIDGWTGIWAEYNPIKFETDGEDISLSGFSAGGSRAFCVGSSLLIETGVGIQYASGSKSMDGMKVEIDLFSAKVPVNILLGFEVPNSSLSIYPFAGVVLRCNITGNLTVNKQEVDVFDEDEMNDTWERFQAYWQIGAKARLGENFMVGVSFGKDLMEIAEECKMQTTSISVGYTF